MKASGGLELGLGSNSVACLTVAKLGIYKQVL